MSLPWSNHRACATQLQHLAPQFRPRSQNCPRCALALAAKSPWTYRHVDSLGTMCALHNLKFDHIAFTQGPTSLSHYRCVMDKNIWAVTALDKTISANISEPFNVAKHLVFFQKSSVRLCIHEELHSGSWDKPYKSLRANRTTSRLAAAVPWFRYPSFRRSGCERIVRRALGPTSHAWAWEGGTKYKRAVPSEF